MFALLEIIDPTASTIENWQIYDLDPEDIQHIECKFNVNIATHDLPVRLRCFAQRDELPYRIHTNRELLLMLNGRKPFAVFCDHYNPDDSPIFCPDKYFQPYVESGRFVKRGYVEFERQIMNGKDCAVPMTHIVMYAKKQEEWRIEAYVLLRNTWKKAGWSEALERMEGSLLGYEEWQNDFHIENSRAK